MNEEVKGSSEFGEEDYEGWCCFWCWWVSFLCEVEAGTGGELPSKDMLNVVVLTYVGARRFTDDGRGCCQTGGS